MRFLLVFFLAMGFFLPRTLAANEYPWEFAGWHGGGCYPNFAFDPLVKNRVYAVSDVAGIYRSDDLGDHWYFVTQGLGNISVSQVAIAPSDSNVLYAAVKTGVYVSRDAGLSWKAADTFKGSIKFVRPDNYRSIAVDPKDPGHVCAGTSEGLFVCSRNFGGKWQEVHSAVLILKKKAPISVVLFDSQGRILAATSDGIIRCANENDECQPLGGPKNVSDLTISVKNPATIIAAGGAQLWFSRNDGSTWEVSMASAPGKIFRIALDESADIPVIRAAWNENWKGAMLWTNNFGETWEKNKNVMKGDMVSNPSRVWADSKGKITGLFIDPFNPQILFRTDWWGMWRSDDGGDTWNEKIVGAPNIVTTQIQMAENGDWYVASMDNGLFRSRDMGKTYETLFPTQWDPARSGHVWRVALAGDIIVATSSPWDQKVNQIIRSTDGGKSFELIRAGLPAARPKQNTMWGEGYPRALAVDPANPDNIYLGIDGDDGGGLFVSHDRGQSWQRSSGQPGSLKIYNALAVDPTDSNRIFWGATGNLGGVYISPDGGKSFVHSLREMSWVFDVKVASDGTIFAAGDSGGPKLYISSNHGRSWSAAGSFGQGRALVSIAVDPSNPKRVAVATASWNNDAPCRIFFSEDGGKRFTDITGSLPDGAGASFMMIDPKSNSLYITRYAGSVYRLKL